jgi:tellurite resistance protein TehA-like permease
MGTGIVSILLHQLPYQFRGLEYLSEIAWMLNVVLFLLLTVASLLRYILWPNLFIEVMKHPVQSCYWYRIHELS